MEEPDYVIYGFIGIVIVVAIVAIGMAAGARENEKSHQVSNRALRSIRAEARAADHAAFLSETEISRHRDDLAFNVPNAAGQIISKVPASGIADWLCSNKTIKIEGITFDPTNREYVIIYQRVFSPPEK